jgi:hypothetical protein
MIYFFNFEKDILKEIGKEMIFFQIFAKNISEKGFLNRNLKEILLLL